MQVTFEAHSISEIIQQMNDFLKDVEGVNPLPVKAVESVTTENPCQVSASETKAVTSGFVFDYDTVFESWEKVFHALKLTGTNGQLRKRLPINRLHFSSSVEFSEAMKDWIAKNTKIDIEKVKVIEINDDEIISQSKSSEPLTDEGF